MQPRVSPLSQVMEEYWFPLSKSACAAFLIGRASRDISESLDHQPFSYSFFYVLEHSDKLDQVF